MREKKKETETMKIIERALTAKKVGGKKIMVRRAMDFIWLPSIFVEMAMFMLAFVCAYVRQLCHLAS